MPPDAVLDRDDRLGCLQRSWALGELLIWEEALVGLWKRVNPCFSLLALLLLLLIFHISSLSVSSAAPDCPLPMECQNGAGKGRYLEQREASSPQGVYI